MEKFRGANASNTGSEQVGNKSRMRVNVSAAAAAALLAMSNASGGPLTLDDLNANGLTGYVGGDAPGSFAAGSVFENFTFYGLDGTKYTTNGRLTSDSTFANDGSTDNLLLDVVDNEGNLVAYLSTGFLSNYVQSADTPGLRAYTARDGSLWGIYQYDNNGVSSMGVLNDNQTRFDLRPIQANAVPEPGTLPLIGLGLAAGAAGLARRRREDGPKKPETKEPETV